MASEASTRDLPPGILEQLHNLDLELEEGDITKKGYEKKKAQLLQPYIVQDVVEPPPPPPLKDDYHFNNNNNHNDNNGDNEQEHPRSSSSSVIDEVEEERRRREDEAALAAMELEPEPSAADVTDFLDYLPSPTHSPTRPEPGAGFMEENHQRMQQQQQQNNNGQAQMSASPTLHHQQQFQQRPLPQQQFPQQQPGYYPGNQYYPGSVPTPRPSWQQPQPQPQQPQYGGMQRPPMGYPQQQPRPGYYPQPQQRPPYNRPPGPPGPPGAPGGYGSPRPMYQPRPINQQPIGSPRPMYRPVQGMSPNPVARPMAPYPGRPIQSSTIPVPNPQQSRHARTSSLESRSDAASIMQGGVAQRPNYAGFNGSQGIDFDGRPVNNGGDDFDTASVSGNNNWRPNNSGRAPSIMSSTSHARASGSHFAMMELARGPIIRRTSLTQGRSRYGNSYMASSFKAVEPAPQPRLLLEDPTEQMLLADMAGRQQLPLQPRNIPFSVIDHTNEHLNLEQKFKNVAEILRYRATKSGNARNNAFTIVDGRGKELSAITWEKLNARAEKVSHMIREKSGLHPGERVALMYRKSEQLEFIVALMGVFLAGMVAVPINAAEELSELSFILSLTNAYLVLTTDFNLKAFTRDMQAKNIEFPSNIDWWKTNDFGSWYPKKSSNSYPPINVSELAYIEYAKATNGELKGVAVNHRTVMSGCTAFQGAVTETKSTRIQGEHGEELALEPVYNARGGPDTVVTYLEQRQQIGLVVSVLWSIFSGSHTVFASSSIVDTPAVWIYVLSKFKATMALADYSSLNYITKYYQSHTKEVLNQSKKVTPDLSSLRFLMVDTLVVKPDLDKYIADSLLKPLRNKTPEETVCPLISLPEHGGMIIGFRDFLGPAQLEQQETIDQTTGEPLVTSVLATGSARDIFECTLNADALKVNKVAVMATGEQARKEAESPEVVHVGSFGFIIPEATIAIVDPETGVLCTPDAVGEIWVDAPSISGGFWGMPKHTEAVFHAKPIIVPADTYRPEIYDQEFLRTGLVGTTIGGRVIVLGPYEERLRQQKLGDTFGLEEVYYSSHMLQTLKKHTPVDQCTIFELAVNDQHVPIVACEVPSMIAKTELGKIANNIIDTMLNFHGLRIYGVIVMNPNTMARWVKHGRRHVHPLMVKRAFMNGEMPIRYLKMDVDRTIFNLATHEDPINGLWRSFAAYDKAIRTGQIMPRPQQQHTGMETVSQVIDERTDFDLSKFTNIVDVLLWRTKLTGEEVAYIAVTQASSGSVINTKPYTWRKINSKIAAVANYLMKKGWKRGRKALILVPFGVEWIQAIYACMVLGVVPVLFEPPDPEQQNLQRLKDEIDNLVLTVRELDITYILTNSAAEDIMKHKNTSMVMKQVMQQYKDKRYRLPEFTNLGKASKTSKVLGKESGFYVKPEWFSTGEKYPALISVHTAMDGTHTYTTLCHETILTQCRTQKMTCQLKSQRSIVGSGLGAYDGLGLLHFGFCGVYVGSPTIMLSVSDFYINPSSYFELLQRYKAKDVCSSHPLIQYYMNYTKKSTPAELRSFLLSSVQNLMLVTEGRPRPGLYQHMAQTFGPKRLEKEAINTVYSHVGNPMITTRSYMLIEPIALLVDFAWLRQGIVRPLPIEDEAYGIILHDSGIVPSNTMVAIVNPETNTVCPSNTVGEIWVSSDCNIKGIYGQTENERQAKFEAIINGGDPRIKYMRTGDLGFLWNVQRRVDRGQPVVEEGQCLFVLGAKDETIERNGLIHFPYDVELTVERCHPGIVPGGCIIFQAGQEVVVVVAVKSNDQAISAVPLVVNAILESHSFLIDTIAVIHSNQLPRTRFGEKQRKKAMASFLEKKLPVLYVSRITNQHEPLSLPQWTQSQLDDTGSVVSMPTGPVPPLPQQQYPQPQTPYSASGRSIAENTDIGRSDSIHSSQRDLERRDTGSSKQSGTRISSVPASPAVAEPPQSFH